MDLLPWQAPKHNAKGYILTKTYKIFKSLQNLLPPYIFLVFSQNGKQTHSYHIYLPRPRPDYQEKLEEHAHPKGLWPLSEAICLWSCGSIVSVMSEMGLGSPRVFTLGLLA